MAESGAASALLLAADGSAIETYRQAELRTRSLPRAERQAARNRLRAARRRLVTSFSEATLRRALADRADGTEALVWFWFNHFNVYWKKAIAGVALPDYVDRVIRPYVTGLFETLLLGVLTHPAMLSYLDNTRNVAGRINENLARELLELHTLGVDGGYTQGDVREVARTLTGLGLGPMQTPPNSKAYEAGHYRFDLRRQKLRDRFAPL